MLWITRPDLICEVTTDTAHCRIAGDGEWVRKLLQRWDERLESDPYLGGSQPGPLDFELLGQMDCMASGLTDWTIPILSRHANLMRWLHRMHARLEGFPTVHSRRVFSPSGGPERATRGEVAWFYLCLLAWLTVLLLPVTLPVLGFAFARRNWNPNRSGARLTEERGKRKKRT